MAYNDGLLSVKMKQVLACALGGAKSDVGLAFHATNKYNMLTANAVDSTLPDGSFSAVAADAEIPLDVGLSATGKTIKDGNTGVLIVTWNGTAIDVELCDDKITVTRANPEAALVRNVGDFVYVPKNFDYANKIIIGFVKVVTVGADFVVGTTAFDAAEVTDTFVDVSNALPGAKLV